MSQNDLKEKEANYGPDNDWYDQQLDSISEEKKRLNNRTTSGDGNEQNTKKDNETSKEKNGGNDANKLGRGYVASKTKSKIKSNVKRRVLIGGIGIFGIMGVVAINFFLSFSGGGIQHLDRLIDSYRLASVNRQFARRAVHIALSDAITHPGSRPINARGTDSLFRRMGGWNSQKAMRALGSTNLEFNFERRGTQNHLLSVTDRTTGRVIERSQLGNAAFANEVTDLVDQRLTDVGKNKFYRRNTVNLVKRNAGLRFYKFREFLTRRGEPIPRSEARRILNMESMLDSRIGRLLRPSRLAVVNEAVQDQQTDVEEGRRRTRGVTEGRQDQLARLNRVSGFSDGAFLATMGCIAGDISGQTIEVIDNRINGPMRAYAEFKTKNDQRRVGDVTPEAWQAETDRWNDWHLSGAAQMAIGRPHDQIADEAKLNEVDYPFQIFGMNVSTVRRMAVVINVVTSPLQSLRDLVFNDEASFSEIPEDGYEDLDEASYANSMPGVCDVLLNPYAQGVIGAAELTATVVSLGGVKAAIAAITSSWRVAGRMIAGTSLSIFALYHVLPSYIDTLAGFDGVALEGEGPENTNKIDVGALMFRQSVLAQSGATIISPSIVSAQQRNAVERYQQEERAKGAFYAYLSPESPFSLTSRLAFSINRNGLQPQKIVAQFFGFISSPFTNSASVAANNGGRYPAEEEFYGMQDLLLGWEDELIDGEGVFDWALNTNYVENNFDRLQSDYAECFGMDMVGFATNNGVADKCKSEEAKRFGLYLLDCQTIDQVTLEGNVTDSFNSTECSFIIGT